MNNLITHLIKAAEVGGKELSYYFGLNLHKQTKTTPSDLKTSADINSEKAIINHLNNSFPTYNIRSEEAGFIDNNSPYTFIIDPLDGSHNYVLGIPNFSVSIGLLKGEDIVAGVVHVPLLKQTFYAEKGCGAYEKKQKLKVNNVQDIQTASVSFTYGYSANQQIIAGIKQNIQQLQVGRLLSHWSPAAEYCLLASGKIEGIINYGNELYDFAAGKLIAKEAGAIITDFNGLSEKNDTSNMFIASNHSKIHKQLLQTVNRY